MINKNITHGIWSHGLVILLTGPIALYYSMMTNLPKNELWVGIGIVIFGILMTRLKMYCRDPQLPRGVINVMVYWFMPVLIVAMMIDGMSQNPGVDIHRIIALAAIYILYKHMEWTYDDDILHLKPS